MSKRSGTKILNIFISNIASPLNLLMMFLLVMNIIFGSWIGIMGIAIGLLNIFVGIVSDLINAKTISKLEYSSENEIDTCEIIKPKNPESRKLFLINLLLSVSLLALLFVYFLVHKQEGYNDLLFQSSYIIGSIAPYSLLLVNKIMYVLHTLRLYKKGIIVQNKNKLESLNTFDVVCFGKNRILTDGSYHLKIVEPLNNQSETQIKQTIANVVNALDDMSSLTHNLKDDVLFESTIKAVKVLNDDMENTFASVDFGTRGIYSIGNIDKIDIQNKQGILFRVKPYIEKGYKVMVLTHSINSLKSEVIAIIVLEESLNLETKEMINWLQRHNKTIKIISDDDPLTLSELGRSLGIMEAEKYVSLENRSDDEIEHMVRNHCVFGHVNAHQKAVVVNALQARGYKVLSVGNEESDTLMLKASDVSVVTPRHSIAARDVSDFILKNSNLNSLVTLFKESKTILDDKYKYLTLELGKTIGFIFYFVLCFIFSHLGIAFGVIIQPFFLYMFEFLLMIVFIVISSLKKNKPYTTYFGKVAFIKVLVTSILLTALLFFFNVLLYFRLEGLIYEGLDDGPVSIDQVTLMGVISISMYYLALIYQSQYPLDKPKRIAYAITVLTSFVLLITDIILSYLTPRAALMNVSILTWNNWIILVSASIIVISAYLYITYIINKITDWKEGKKK